LTATSIAIPMPIPSCPPDFAGAVGSPLESLIVEGSLQAAYGVYLGEAELRAGKMRVLPLRQFLRELASGNILVPGK
jgi:hypothetical protein